MSYRYLAALESAEASLPILVLGARLLEVMVATKDEKVANTKQYFIDMLIKVTNHGDFITSLRFITKYIINCLKIHLKYLILIFNSFVKIN